ncbi:MAG: recombinase family protein [Proteobacteria bacterium]|nr:recombinase family protein [Pseudomonadota bacterium]MBU1418259.1 recombinase family protein [Pseudomonadota bacterium]MBU1453337.1 recombinase family protein [Pseudomonadota bacterium]
MNAAIYIRKSREDEGKHGHRLTVQRERLPEYAREQGWSPHIYDDGHSSAARGKVAQLPERSRLELDIKAGKIDIILVIELSRLSRDDTMQDYIAWLTLCSDHNVKLATLSRILDPAQHSDWMLLLMEGGFSSVEMKILQKRMSEGRNQAFAAGKFMGGTPPKPYLYDKGERKLFADPILLEEIEALWTMAETISAKAIAEEIGWPEIAVRRAISDDRLLFYQAKRLDKETGTIISCDWDPVMSATRAERIRRSRRTRKTNGKRRDAAGLLTAMGIFFCGYCGKTVKSWNNSKVRLDGTRLDYYACTTKNRKHVCPKSRMIAHTTVDDKVLRNIFSTFDQGEELKKYWQQFGAGTKHDDTSQEILTQIKTAEKKKENIVSAIAAGVIDFSDAKGQIDTIKHELIDLNNQLDSQANAPKEPDWESITFTPEEFKLIDFHDKRKAIQGVITSITLYNTYAIINYPFPRTKTGSHEARINLARGKMYKLKNQNRTRA